MGKQSLPVACWGVCGRSIGKQAFLLPRCLTTTSFPELRLSQMGNGHGRHLCIQPSSRGRIGNRPYVFQHAQTHSSSWVSACQSTQTASPTSVHQERNVGGEVVSHQEVLLTWVGQRILGTGFQQHRSCAQLYLYPHAPDCPHFRVRMYKPSWDSSSGQESCQVGISCDHFLWGQPVYGFGIATHFPLLGAQLCSAASVVRATKLRH